MVNMMNVKPTANLLTLVVSFKQNPTSWVFKLT